MKDCENNLELIEKKQLILKQSDGIKRSELFLDLLAYSLHEKKSIADFFQVKKWIFDHFDQGYKNKELIEKYKILEQEGFYLKKNLIKDGDFAIEQMQIALNDLRGCLQNLSVSIKKVLLPRVLVSIKSKQLVDDLRAVRLLSKLRIRLFDIQKELGSLNSTMSKKNHMFQCLRDFFKQVNVERNNLLEKIAQKIEILFFKNLEKKICTKTNTLRDERESLLNLDEIEKLKVILDAMRLPKSIALDFTNRLETFRIISNSCLEKQKQVYLNDKQSQEEKKEQFIEKIEKAQNLDELLNELNKSSLYIEFKKELQEKIIKRKKQRINEIDKAYLLSKEKEEMSEQAKELRVKEVLESIDLCAKDCETKTLAELESNLSDFMKKIDIPVKRIDVFQYECSLARLINSFVKKQNNLEQIQKQKAWSKNRIKVYQDLKVKGSLAFDEALELNHLMQVLKENEELCISKLG